MMLGLLAVGPNASQDDVLYTLGMRCEELLGENAMEAVPYLAHMMSLDLGEEWAWVKDLDPKVRQKQTQWAACEFLTAAASENHIVIALDDLHWADEATLALVERLLSAANQVPIMFCLVFRGRRDKYCWKLREAAVRDYPHRYTELALEPLDLQTSSQLLGKLLPGAQFKPETRNEILDKAAGNPFYLEEVVRSLIENGAVIPDPGQDGAWLAVPDRIAQISVPDSLHAAIVARIDRLTEDARLALQIAAVIGRQFRLQLLRNLAQAEAEIDLWLAQLERGGMVKTAEISQDPLYAFPDALVQEVAYDSLLVQNRQQLHRQIGETLETVFANNPEQGCELLAYHFGRSDDPLRAIQYLEMSAKKARSEYANETAIQYYQQLLEIHRKFKDVPGQAGALYPMGVIAYEIGDYARARTWLEESMELWEQAEDKANAGWSIMYLGMVALKKADYGRAAELHARALQLAQERGDAFQEGIHLTNLARVNMRLGLYELALEQFHKSLEMKRALKDLTGMGFALFYKGMVYIDQALYELAQAALQEALEAWEQVPKNERVISYYHYGEGILALRLGQLQQAQEHLQKACDLSARLLLKAETIENLSALSQVKLNFGELDAAHELSKRAVCLLESQKDVEEVQQIYLNHYHVLTALQDSSANEYLKEAYDTMIQRADQIEDGGTRCAYLERVRVNQEITALMQIKSDPEVV
jgi:tetratricopeptide (TPR) repeat protein